MYHFSLRYAIFIAIYFFTDYNLISSLPTKNFLSIIYLSSVPTKKVRILHAITSAIASINATT